MSSSFTISPVVDADFDRMLTYTEKAGGTLAAPLVFATWPAPARDTVATDRRNKWSIEQQRWQFHNDATAHFVKVEDTMTQEIISLARWHRYPKGYPQEDAYMEVDVFARPDRGLSPNFPDGLNGPLHKGLLETALKRRPDYVSPGLSWILTTLVTRENWRRRGAGGMLLQWGLHQAAKDGVPAYIEAVPTAVSTYKRHGFKEIEEMKVDCRGWGLDADFVLAIMRKDP